VAAAVAELEIVEKAPSLKLERVPFVITAVVEERDPIVPFVTVQFVETRVGHDAEVITPVANVLSPEIV
jgi:hypothetical protein